MMQYTADKYGDDKVAQIITFGTLGARAAIRDVGRVMDIPLNEVDRVAKLIPNIPGKPVKISEALEDVSEFKELYQNTPYLRELIDTAESGDTLVFTYSGHGTQVYDMSGDESDASPSPNSWSAPRPPKAISGAAITERGSTP